MSDFFNMGHWFWIVLGVLLLIAELAGAGGYLLCVGASGLLVGLAVAIIPMSWEFQLIIFAVLSVTSTYAYWKYFKPHNTVSEDPILNNRMARLKGTKTSIISVLGGGYGKVQIADALWDIRCDQAVSEGQLVEVIGYEESTLIVKIL